MKLKTVSALVLAFSLLCLAAFVAGHPPMPRAQLRPQLSSRDANSRALEAHPLSGSLVTKSLSQQAGGNPQ